MCLGDYNEILVFEEKQGRITKPLYLMMDFWEALLDCNLVDLDHHGNVYTWNNGREAEDYVQARLDRACATVDWQEFFPHYKVSHLQVSYSDHVPIMVCTHN